MFTPSQYLSAIREAFLYNDRSFGLEKKWLNIECAKLIEQADPEQLLFIVDWDSEISFAPTEQEKHNAVCVWQSSEYRTTYSQYQTKKELSEKERQQSYRYTEVRDRLKRKVIRDFFSAGADDKESKQAIETMVDKLIASRSEIVAKQFNIDFRDLLQADKDLSEFKRKNKIK